MRMRLNPAAPWDENPHIVEITTQVVDGHSYVDQDAGPPGEPDVYWTDAAEASIRWGSTPVPDDTWSDWTAPKTGVPFPA